MIRINLKKFFLYSYLNNNYYYDYIYENIVGLCKPDKKGVINIEGIKYFNKQYKQSVLLYINSLKESKENDKKNNEFLIKERSKAIKNFIYNYANKYLNVSLMLKIIEKILEDKQNDPNSNDPNIGDEKHFQDVFSEIMEGIYDPNKYNGRSFIKCVFGIKDKDLKSQNLDNEIINNKNIINKFFDKKSNIDNFNHYGVLCVNSDVKFIRHSLDNEKNFQDNIKALTVKQIEAIIEVLLNLKEDFKEILDGIPGDFYDLMPEEESNQREALKENFQIPVKALLIVAVVAVIAIIIYILYKKYYSTNNENNNKYMEYNEYMEDQIEFDEDNL